MYETPTTDNSNFEHFGEKLEMQRNDTSQHYSEQMSAFITYMDGTANMDQLTGLIVISK